jgi:hypothetical protein
MVDKALRAFDSRLRQFIVNDRLMGDEGFNMEKDDQHIGKARYDVLSVAGEIAVGAAIVKASAFVSSQQSRLPSPDNPLNPQIPLLL